MFISKARQGSDEWLSIRKSRPTASNFSRIVTTQGKKSSQYSAYMAEIIAAHLGYQAHVCKSQVMERGNELEPFARAAYSFVSGNAVIEVGHATLEDDLHSPGCSVDGLVGDDGMIEIKCPLLHTHYKTIIDRAMPDGHIQQVHGCLWITDRQWCDFISYNPDALQKDKLFIHRVNRDEKFINALSSNVLEFSNKLKEVLYED